MISFYTIHDKVKVSKVMNNRTYENFNDEKYNNNKNV